MRVLKAPQSMAQTKQMCFYMHSECIDKLRSNTSKKPSHNVQKEFWDHHQKNVSRFAVPYL